MSTAPFKPITREQAAEILSVSLSTLDAMIASGVLPPPRPLGDCRKLYWHPDVFYGALHRLLWVDPAPVAAPAPEAAEPTCDSRRLGRAPTEATPTRSEPKATAPPTARSSRDARTRQAERLQELNR